VHAVVQSDVILHAHNRCVRRPTPSMFCDLLAYLRVSDALHQVAGVTDGHVSCTMYTHQTASVPKFCSRLGFWVNQTVCRKQISGLIKSGVPCWRSWTVSRAEWRQKANLARFFRDSV